MLSRITVVLLAVLFATNTVAQSGLRVPKSPSGASGATERSKPAAKPPADTKSEEKASEEDSAGVRAVEGIFACLSAGLPREWRRAWAVVSEVGGDGKERTFEGKFFYSLEADGSTPLALVPCSSEDAGRRIYALNDFLEYEKRNWKTVTLTFTNEGKFDLKYDYVK